MVRRGASGLLSTRINYTRVLSDSLHGLMAMRRSARRLLRAPVYVKALERGASVKLQL